MITMVALLIAVGLLMDDAIVIAENIARHRHAGLTPLDAAVTGTKEVAPGVLASFFTTVSVFGALAFLHGDIGSILKVMPIILILTLSFSLVEAFLILPHHLMGALRAADRADAGRFRARFDAGLARFTEGFVGPLVDAAVGWRYLTVGPAGWACWSAPSPWWPGECSSSGRSPTSRATSSKRGCCCPRARRSPGPKRWWTV